MPGRLIAGSAHRRVLCWGESRVSAAFSEIELRHAIPERRNGVRFILRYVKIPDEGPMTVSLTVVADEEAKYVLAVGETFSARGETWVVARADPTSGDARAVLRLMA